MIAMQYKILLPDDYNMDNIRQRVKSNGYKTDGFQDLMFKAYLIMEKDSTSESHNEYSPLYLWKDSEGMNKFIFEGFYNNILQFFGWQKINIGIPFLSDLGKEFQKSRYAMEIENDVLPTEQILPLSFLKTSDKCLGKVLIYNPDKWKYVEYRFYESEPEKSSKNKIYQILHISTDFIV